MKFSGILAWVYWGRDKLLWEYLWNIKFSIRMNWVTNCNFEEKESFINTAYKLVQYNSMFCKLRFWTINFNKRLSAENDDLSNRYVYLVIIINFWSNVEKSEDVEGDLFDLSRTLMQPQGYNSSHPSKCFFFTINKVRQYVWVVPKFSRMYSASLLESWTSNDWHSQRSEVRTTCCWLRTLHISDESSNKNLSFQLFSHLVHPSIY